MTDRYGGFLAGEVMKPVSHLPLLRLVPLPSPICPPPPLSAVAPLGSPRRRVQRTHSHSRLAHDASPFHLYKGAVTGAPLPYMRSQCPLSSVPACLPASLLASSFLFCILPSFLLTTVFSLSLFCPNTFLATSSLRPAFLFRIYPFLPSHLHPYFILILSLPCILLSFLSF